MLLRNVLILLFISTFSSYVRELLTERLIYDHMRFFLMELVSEQKVMVVVKYKGSLEKDGSLKKHHGFFYFL